MPNTVIVYHANCTDGFAAAWAAAKALNLPQANCIPAVYQSRPPDVRGSHVVMVDFSYPYEKLKALWVDSASLTVIDHHASAKPVLDALSDEFLSSLVQGGEILPSLVVVFDLARSGCGLTWDQFNAGKPRPPLLDLLEARDLHRDVAGAQEAHEMVASYPFEFEFMDRLMAQPIEDVVAGGSHLMRKASQDVARLLAITARKMSIAGHLVNVANLPITMTMLANDVLGDGQPFSATYFDTPEGRTFSLRAQSDIDVSKIAALFGGGGHRAAAGFRVPYADLAEKGLL